MHDWWARNSETREPHAKAEAADFGMDFGAIRPLFADYVSHAARWTKDKGTHGFTKI